MIVTLDIDYMIPNNKSIFDFYNIDNFYKQEVKIEHIDFIKKLLSDKKIIILNSHDEIVKYINQNDVVINIDHHHDLLYDRNIGIKTITNWETSQIENRESVWAMYCINKKNIKYYWCKNENSYEDINLFGINFNYITEDEILSLKDKYDTIYIIKSYNYVTEKQLKEIGDIIGRKLY